MKGINLKDSTRVYMLLFLLCIFKFLLYGFSYFPILDDFIQYDGYRLYGDLSYVYFGIGTIATRPLASILDPLFWGAMPKGLALFIITMLHFFSAVFFCKSAEKLDIKLTSVFAIVYLLLPLASESTYWLSASTRVVCGLFLSSVGIYFLCCYIKNRKKSLIFGFWLLTFLSSGFYEAALAFSACASLLIMIYFSRQIKDKWIYAIPFANCAAFCGIYSALSNVGMMGSRAQGFKISTLFTAEKFGEFFTQLGEILGNGLLLLTKNSFFTGLGNLLSGKFFGALVLLLILLCSICFLFKPKEGEGKVLAPLIFAVIMFFAPLAVNFLPEEMWLTFRSLGFSIFALALLSDRLISLIKSRYAVGIISALLAFIFAVGCAGEYSVYREVSETDTLLCSKIYNGLEAEVLSGEREAVVVLEKYPENTQTYFYKDHVKSVFYTDWSLTGAVRAAGGNIKIKKITPVISGAEFEKENKQIIYIDENFDIKGES